MLTNILDNRAKRCISTCNFNQHIHNAHPDRIMDEHDLIYIREGEWDIGQEDEVYHLIPGDLILLQSGYHHYGISPCKSVVKTCFVHFTAHESDTVSGSDCSDPDFWTFPMVVHCKDNPMVGHFFSQIIYAYWSEDEYSQKKASAYLDLLLCEISSDKNAKGSNLVEDIKLQIKNTPGCFISNEEFAQRHNCSVRTISSKFKESTGCSLHAWQMKLKCQMADELMRSNPSLTLKEIAANYGFYDEYHFGKCFKKVMGRSPKQAKV